MICKLDMVPKGDFVCQLVGTHKTQVAMQVAIVIAVA